MTCHEAADVAGILSTTPCAPVHRAP
eukprot:COSAG03_NODE_30415_length_161_cov_61.064516_1_plen_25_part_10